MRAKAASADLEERYPSLRRLARRGRRRVPVVQQLAAADCGAACLAMVLAYYGKEVAVEDLRALMGIGRDGLVIGSSIGFSPSRRLYEAGGQPMNQSKHGQDAHATQASTLFRGRGWRRRCTALCRFDLQQLHFKNQSRIGCDIRPHRSLAIS